MAGSQSGDAAHLISMDDCRFISQNAAAGIQWPF
jgi:hypothetical protein